MDERVPGWMADQIEVDMVPRLNEVLRADVAARAEGGCVELRHPSPVGCACSRPSAPASP